MATDAPLMGEPLPVELMNTVWADRDGVHDSLGDRAAAYAWLESVAPRIDIDAARLARAAAADSGQDQDAALLRRLRDSLRRLAADATADDRAAAASPVADVSTAAGEVNEALRSAAGWPALVADGNGGWTRRVESARGPLAAAVGSIASQAIDLFAGPLRGELRACRAPGCVLYFVRHHPRREWCSAACGNRARVARHYHRHAGSAGLGSAPPGTQTRDCHWCDGSPRRGILVPSATTSGGQHGQHRRKQSRPGARNGDRGHETRGRDPARRRHRPG